MRNTLWAPGGAVAVCAGPSAALAQFPNEGTIAPRQLTFAAAPTRWPGSGCPTPRAPWPSAGMARRVSSRTVTVPVSVNVAEPVEQESAAGEVEPSSA
jgi:hypothetical protein